MNGTDAGAGNVTSGAIRRLLASASLTSNAVLATAPVPAPGEYYDASSVVGRGNEAALNLGGGSRTGALTLVAFTGPPECTYY